MKFIYCFIACLSISQISAGVVPLSFTKRSSPNVESHVSISKRDSSPVSRYFVKRSSNADPIPLDNGIISYFVDLEVGTPPQVISSVIDTGSSDLWFVGTTNPLCGNTTEQFDNGYINCTGVPTFDVQNSSTYSALLADPFYIQYGDSTFAQGYLGTDTLKLGDFHLSKAYFAVANQTNSTVPVFGIGLEGNEATNYSLDQDVPPGYPPPFTYPNIPSSLKSEGYIDSVAYSLYLDDIDVETGSILFGGVDHAKYDGGLTTLPLLGPAEDQIDQFLVELTKVEWNVGGETIVLGEGSVEALLDSGTTMSLVPSAVFYAIKQALNVTWNDDIGYVVSGNYKDAGNLTYSFNGATINVPFSELIVDVVDENYEPVFVDGQPLANFLVGNGGRYPILGDTFLRSAYVVYDLENKEVSIAQGKFDGQDSDIEPIISTVPGAIRDPTATFKSTVTGFANYTASVALPTTYSWSQIDVDAGVSKAVHYVRPSITPTAL